MAETKKTSSERWNAFCESLKIKVAAGNKEISMTDEHLTAMEALVTERDVLKSERDTIASEKTTLTAEKTTLAADKSRLEGELAAEKSAHGATQADYEKFKKEDGAAATTVRKKKESATGTQDKPMSSWAEKAARLDELHSAKEEE